MAKRNLFNSVQLQRPKRNVFDLSHDVKFSFDMGELIPVCLMECVPGDKFNIGCQALIRFAPMVAPVMHRFNVFIHYFFVPNRIVWSNWEPFIFQSLDPEGFAHPWPTVILDETETEAGKLPDYLGVPQVTTALTNLLSVGAIPFGAYQMIYNEYYRDQNLINPVDFAIIDGNNDANADLLVLRRRAWEHDYFTSSLPFAQKGAAVGMPLSFNDLEIKVNLDPGVTPSVTWATTTPPAGSVTVDSELSAEPGITGLYAPLEGAVGTTTINDLRRAYRLQEWLERNARGGTRPVESILVHFGVRSSDARLNRPEYITGFRSPVVISEVLNTAGSFDAGDPADPTSPVQGNMSGHGVAVATGKYGKFFCEEHGYIVGIMSVMPKTAYQQGLPRHFSKGDPFDYYWPEFANIGEQEVRNLEIMADADPLDPPASPFGYVPRYSEYKFMPSRVAGDFKTTLDYWHSGRIFVNPPELNEDFITCNPGKRIFAVDDPDVDSLYASVFNNITAVRPMPKFGTPVF